MKNLLRKSLAISLITGSLLALVGQAQAARQPVGSVVVVPTGPVKPVVSF